MIFSFLAGVVATVLFGSLYLVWLGEESYKGIHLSFPRWLIKGNK